MKLSHLTTGILILSATISLAQQKPKTKQESTTLKNKTTKHAIKNTKTVKDSSETKITRSPGYCPPCGRG